MKRIGVHILLCVLFMGGVGLAGGVVGALWYIILPAADSLNSQDRSWSQRRRDRQRRDRATDAAMEDTTEDMSRRFWIGGGIGAVVGLGLYVGGQSKWKQFVPPSWRPEPDEK